MTRVERLLGAVRALVGVVIGRRTLLTALYASTLVVTAVMWLVSIPHLATYTALPILDVRTEAYGLADAQKYLDALHDGGAAAYLGVQLRLDGVFPFLYGASLSHLLSLVLARAGLAPRWALAVAVLVVAPTCVLDLMENDAIAPLLKAGAANATEAQAAAASVATLAKWRAAKLAVTFALAALALALWKFMREEQQ